jgi:antibiotic biosynthesis monooxygenase (ABM) superfamily enzyme
MSSDSRTVLSFAVKGAVIAALASTGLFAYLKADPPANWKTTGVVLVAIVLCPGFILFVWAVGIELEIPSLLVVGLIVTVINFVLYAAICAAYVKLRNWREGLQRRKA